MNKGYLDQIKEMAAKQPVQSIKALSADFKEYQDWFVQLSVEKRLLVCGIFAQAMTNESTKSYWTGDKTQYLMDVLNSDRQLSF